MNRHKAEGKSVQLNAGTSQDQNFINNFLQFMNKGTFYFSDEYNLTNTMQDLSHNNFDFHKYDKQFLINANVIEKFWNSKVNTFNYVSQFILGFVKQIQLTNKVDNQTLLTLISRKNV